MIKSADSPLHRSISIPRPAHRGLLALPGPDLARSTLDPDAVGACIAAHCAVDREHTRDEHADDSIAPSAFGPVARWGRVGQGGAA